MSSATRCKEGNDSSLLDLVRQFEKQLERLSETDAVAQERGGDSTRRDELASGAGLPKLAPTVDVEAGGAARDGGNGSTADNYVKQSASMPATRAQKPQPPRDVARARESVSSMQSLDESSLNKPLLDHAESTANKRHRKCKSGLTIARAQSLAINGTLQRGWFGERIGKKTREEQAGPKWTKTFYHNLAVALRMAFWCTVFGIPIYNRAAYDFIFGSARCQPSQVGRFVEASDGSLIPYHDSMRRPWTQTDDVWCGCLPQSFLGYWSNVIQMVIYTVFQTCGTTINLAWDGFLGTILAIVNVYVMMAIWPGGATDPDYSAWISWIDCLGVIFAFLISKYSTNTIKFGMSWHVFLMMSFMNPNTGPNKGTIPTGIPGVKWDSEATVVLLTTVAGLVLAVFVTYLPYPMLNITRIDDDAKTASEAIELIWNEALDYFCGNVQKAKRFQIETRIVQLSGTIAKIRGNLEASWWETLDLFKYGRKRKLYAALDDEFEKIQMVLNITTNCIHQAKFDEDHTKFMNKKMFECCSELMNAAARLLRDSSKFCVDGIIDEEEKKQLREDVALVKRCQLKLLDVYDESFSADKDQDLINGAISNCTIFLYALSVFAWRVGEFAEHHLVGPEPTDRGNCCGSLCGPMIGVWEDMLEVEHRNFAVRNFLSISICYVLGYYLHGSMFGAGYNYNMANTLTLLITRYVGTTFDVNMKRLIGVALGKVLPILVMAVVSLFPCFSTSAMAVHATSIFLYIFIFEYMYFTSAHWYYIGMCAAAFGCTFLYAPCVQKTDLAAQFADRYEEIGQVIFAMVIQIVVDFAMRSRSTRQIAVEHVVDLGEDIQRGFQGFFEGDPDFPMWAKRMKASAGPAEEFRPMTDPKLSVVPGPQTPFQNDLYEKAVEGLKMTINDFETICMCSQIAHGDSQMFNGQASLLDFVTTLGTMEDVQLDFMSLLGLTRRCVDIILRHDTENAVQDTELAELEAWAGLMTLSDVPGLLKEAREKAGHEFARLPSENFTITCCDQGMAGLDVSQHLSIVDVKQDAAAANAGLSEKNKGWIVTHVDGEEVTYTSGLETLRATQGPGRRFSIQASAPHWLCAEPRVRLIVMIKALRNARCKIGSIAAYCVKKNTH